MIPDKDTTPSHPSDDVEAGRNSSQDVTHVPPATGGERGAEVVDAGTPPVEDFAALFEASEAKGGDASILVGDVIRGRVVAIGQTSAFVAVGAKGEAEIDLTEFRNPTTGDLTLKVGDRIEATVIDDGRTGGSIVLKQTVGRGAHLPAELERAMEHGIAVEGVVTGENKGGFDVQICGVRAFCPGSQIDLRRGGRRMATEYVGQRLRFTVTRIEAGGRNVVVSRRRLLEEEAEKLAAETWKRLEVGAVVSGTVTSLQNFGAFVDIGGVEGLIHVTELGYGRVGHPSEVLSEGQTVETQVVAIELPKTEGGRAQIGLSLKALAKDPWDTVLERFPVGTTVRGTVRRLEGFGAFVEIAPGLDGLVHVSKMVLDRRISHPRQAVSPGDEVEATVLAVDTERHRVSLSMIEKARAADDAIKARDRADEQAIMAAQNRPSSLGTLADLLVASKNKRR
jgi:small subunit ribosomal protein S1